jgi:hypothetical protein
MNQKFRNLIEQLPAKCKELTETHPVRVSSLPRDLPKSGIYVFYEDGEALYVGRTNSMRRRLQHHCSRSAKDAPLAFRIARKETGYLTATYKPKGSRSELRSNPEFEEAYLQAKGKIREMDIRYVEIEDQALQALLEIYATLELDAEYNDFDTH